VADRLVEKLVEKMLDKKAEIPSKNRKKVKF